MSVRIKICGLTRAEDVEAALGLGVDAIGLVFAPISSRRLDLPAAQALSAQARGRTSRVGVFVDEEAASVRAAIAQVGLDALQFHGQEDAAYCASFGLPYLKAVQVSGPVDEAGLRRRFPNACALLLDAGAGGGGQPFDWRHWPCAPTGRCVLAGGLAPHSVGQAVRTLKPWGVDVSSGVEGPHKGVKDADRMKAFVEEARRAANGQ